jgi:hypothetical protein
VKTSKTTLVAVSITAVFFLSYLPYFALSFVRAFMGDLDRTLRGAPLVAFNIFHYFPYLNAVANPLIYSVLNLAFRSECAKLLGRLAFWRRRGGGNVKERSTDETACSSAMTAESQC